MWDDTDRRQATCSFHFVKHFLSHFFIIKGCSLFHSTAKSATRLHFSDLMNWKCFFFNLIVDYSNCTQNECIKVSVCKSLRGAIVSMISHSLHVASCHHFSSSSSCALFCGKKTFIGLCILREENSFLSIGVLRCSRRHKRETRWLKDGELVGWTVPISFRSSIENHHSMQIHVIFLPCLLIMSTERGEGTFMHDAKKLWAME